MNINQSSVVSHNKQGDPSDKAWGDRSPTPLPFPQKLQKPKTELNNQQNFTPTKNILPKIENAFLE